MYERLERDDAGQREEVREGEGWEKYGEEGAGREWVAGGRGRGVTQGYSIFHP